MTTPTIPTWPRERDLATYAKYTCINFDLELSDGKTWIDIRLLSKPHLLVKIDLFLPDKLPPTRLHEVYVSSSRT